MTIHPFPTRLREPPVDLDGNRVLIRGRIYRTFNCGSNAIRVAAALQVLADLGCELPSTTCLRA